MLKLVLLYWYFHNTYAKCLKHQKTVFIYVNVFFPDPLFIKTPTPACLHILHNFVGPLHLSSTEEKKELALSKLIELLSLNFGPLVNN